jgi:restriction endonuclease S subunit
MLSLIDGVAITRLTLAKLNSALIPFPPLNIQREIVDQIEAERALVESTRRLIEIFEAKIKAKLDEIWGTVKEADRENDALEVEEGTQDIGDSLA